MRACVHVGQRACMSACVREYVCVHAYLRMRMRITYTNCFFTRSIHDLMSIVIRDMLNLVLFARNSTLPELYYDKSRIRVIYTYLYLRKGCIVSFNVKKKDFG